MKLTLKRNLPLMMKNGHEIGQKMAHALWKQAAE